MGMGMGKMGMGEMGMGKMGMGEMDMGNMDMGEMGMGRMGPNDADWEEFYDLGTPLSNGQEAPTYQEFGSSLRELDVHMLTNDIRRAMFHNRFFWPADFGGVSDGMFSGEGGRDGDRGNYGPLFVRLAWHCSGTWHMAQVVALAAASVSNQSAVGRTTQIWTRLVLCWRQSKSSMEMH